MTAKLASNRSPRWAFMDRFEVPQYDGPGNYLTRWRVVQTPWFGLFVHRYDGPDPRATLHDHPFRFLSIVLRGGYAERRLDPQTGRLDLNVSRVQLTGAEDMYVSRLMKR